MAGVRLRLLSIFAALLVVAGCGADPAPRPSASAAGTPTPTLSGGPAAKAATLAASLSDEDLVGQVLMPYAYGASATDVSAGSAAGNRKLAGVDTPAEMIAKYRLGGLILVGFSADDPTSKNQTTTNVDSVEQVRGLTTGLQDAAAKLPAGAAPMLIGTDQEYGVVTRVKTGVTGLPSAMAFGAAGNPQLTESAWRAAGAELAALGINVDFAPVADVLGSGGSSVIGSRSYGSDTAKVSAQVAGAVRGLQAGGVAATLKHFPGHGHTTGDSHDSLPKLTQSRAGLDAADLPPFTAGIGAGAKLVMSGHLDVRAIDPGMPATFSHKMLTDVLRGQLGFKGVVVTDGMNMAPARRWQPGEAAVRAVNAGNDLLLMPDNLPLAYNGLLSALRTGELSKDRLVEAATRVLTLKFELALAAVPQMSTVGSADHQRDVAKAAAAAVTQLRGACGGPLVRGPVTVTAAGGRTTTKGWLVDALRATGAEVVDSGGAVIHLVGYGDKRSDLRKGAAVTVAMDTPYLLADADSPVLLATYSSSRLSMVALADVLAGKAPADGRSPVAVRGLPRTSCGG
ncbi:glycoside hydrolase family 3 protein [Phytohabitans rumicis]|uniref:beta-N-acetylhexosaminidase n=1 Tax=Phytohabitans rumicis TaxID=1076125 RepID=A0A6V8LDX7_9ACTN|nr:glycoside hydrolase family 3 N-terminal domain-containing protein [Phytohabitans rumicis]GFJ92296.1 beta-N-acetylhexosaminidase [Phytohabitans rumicis]